MNKNIINRYCFCLLLICMMSMGNLFAQAPSCPKYRAILTRPDGVKDTLAVNGKTELEYFQLKVNGQELWNTSSGEGTFSFIMNDDDTLELVHQNIQACDQRIIMYNLSGGQWSRTSIDTVFYEDYTIFSDVPSRNLYGFAHWQSNLSSKKYYPNDTLTNLPVGAVSLTAQWAELPVVLTIEPANVAAYTAVAEGNVTSAGGGTLTAVGIEYATSSDFASATAVTATAQTGTFTASLTGLTKGTTYYVRAYATNEAGTVYGSTATFTTVGDAAVATGAVSNILATTATAGGEVTSAGGGTLTAVGIEYATSSDFATVTTVTAPAQTGTFTASLTGLTKGTTYYVRAYAANEAGTVYGSSATFTTPALIVSTITQTDSSATSLSVSAAYTSAATLTAATICAYTDANCTILAGTCATNVAIGASAITGTLTGLDVNTQYYVKVTASIEGDSDNNVGGPFKTSNVTLTLSSNPNLSTIYFCGKSKAKVTYTAHLSSPMPSATYSWKVNGVDSTTTDSVLTVRYTSASSYTVTCSAAGASATMTSTVTTGGTLATLSVCENYATPSVTVTTNCPTANIVWKDSTGRVVRTNNTVLSGIAAGHYSVEGTTNTGCSIMRPVYLGTANKVGCVGSEKSNETAANGVVTAVRDHQTQSYEVISLGGYCVMKSNLKVTTTPEGTALTWGAPYAFTTSNMYAYVLGGVTYCVYSWRAAMNYTTSVDNMTSTQSFENRRGLCPEGWCIPTNEQWSAIFNCHDAGQLCHAGAAATSYNANAPGNASDPEILPFLMIISPDMPITTVALKRCKRPIVRYYVQRLLVQRRVGFLDK